jgi:excisionase family DNA binding protein
MSEVPDRRQPPHDDEWLTPAEFAAELRVHPSTVRLWVNTGQVRAVRSGRRRWLVARSEIDRLVRPASARTDRVSPTAPDPYSPPTLRPGERVIVPDIAAYPPPP